MRFGMRAGAVAALVLVVWVLAGCGPGPAATSGPASASATSSVPTAAPTAPPATTSPTATVAATGTTVRNAAQGLAITLPADWIALTPEIAKDSAAVAALKASAGSRASLVDSLLATLTQHPEYWMAAGNITNQNVMTGSLFTDTGDLAAWTTAQEAALKNAYGTVETTPLTSPKPGTAFTFTSGQFASRLYGFARPDGVAIFTFAGPAAEGAPAAWDEIVSTFEDAGT